MIVRVLVAAGCFALPGCVARAQACDSTVLTRASHIKSRLVTDPRSALSEARLILLGRADRDACARIAVIATLGPHSSDEAQRLLVGVVRSEPDPQVRAIAAQALANATQRTPELTHFLAEFPDRPPRRPGIPGIVVVRGHVTDGTGAVVPGVMVSVSLADKECRPRSAQRLDSRTAADGTYEVAFEIGPTRASCCAEVSWQRRTARASLSLAASELSVAKSDTIRLDLGTARR